MEDTKLTELRKEAEMKKKELDALNDQIKEISASQKELADKEIKELTDKAYAALGEAEQIAEKYGTSFNFDISYGMGGTYVSQDEVDTGDWGHSSSGWLASSDQC